MTERRNRDQIVEYIYSMNLQNLTERTDFDRAFLQGIENTVDDLIELGLLKPRGMTEKITIHNKEVNDLLNRVLIDGQSYKLMLEAYLSTIEAGIESGKLTGKRKEKGESLADCIAWSLSMIEEMTTLLTTQSNIQNELQEVIRLTNG